MANGDTQYTQTATKRGRKPASESRAAEIRTKLLAWRQTPEAQRISLRALAIEIGTSHQLLSFHLQRLDDWQMKEYEKKAQEIHARARGESRPMTQEEQTQYAAYGRASFNSMIDSATTRHLREMRKVLTHGSLSGIQVKIAKLLASEGYREAQEILGRSSSTEKSKDNSEKSKNNLPTIPSGAVKSFRPASR